jgi:hypothetical protein
VAFSMAATGMAITVDWGSEHSVNAATPALKQMKGLDVIVALLLTRLIRSSVLLPPIANSLPPNGVLSSEDV